MQNQDPERYVLEHIKELCRERDWSLYRLAKESSLPYSTLNNLFHRGNIPSVSTLNRICEAFGISLSEFFRDRQSSDAPGLEQDNLLKSWNLLSNEDRKLVKIYIAGLLKKLPD